MRKISKKRSRYRHIKPEKLRLVSVLREDICFYEMESQLEILEDSSHTEFIIICICTTFKLILMTIALNMVGIFFLTNLRIPIVGTALLTLSNNLILVWYLYKVVEIVRTLRNEDTKKTR